jgi:hypothetical protein
MFFLLIVCNVGVYAVRRSKIKRISTRREQNRRFYSDIVLQVRVKSAILRFKAKDEALSSTLNSDGHKHFVSRCFFQSFQLVHLLQFHMNV